MINFSKRTDIDFLPNEIYEMLYKKQSGGEKIFDLTSSNPTKEGLQHEPENLIAAFSKKGISEYSPDARGLESARLAVKAYYNAKNIEIDLDSIILTSGTSEAYSFLFKLLTDPGDEVLIPAPGYPLLGHLCVLENVIPVPYNLLYNRVNGWEIDFNFLKKRISDRTKAVIIVNPNNPTGSFIKNTELEEIITICAENNIALISDEVFSDFTDSEDMNIVKTTAGINHCLSFVVSGLSKVAALPQVKLSWIIVQGNKTEKKSALEKLEFISDNYLSVSTLSQVAAEDFFAYSPGMQMKIMGRIKNNLKILESSLTGKPNAELLKYEGGWYAILKFADEIEDDNRVYDLLNRKNILVHTGYFFDCDTQGLVILSLIVSESDFREGIKRLLD